MGKRGGWYGDSARHALARRGISTTGPVIKTTPPGRTAELNMAVERTLEAGVSLQDIQNVVEDRNPWFSWEELKEIKRELKELRVEAKIKRLERKIAAEEKKAEKHKLARERLKTKREVEEMRRPERVTTAVTKERTKGGKARVKEVKVQRKLTHKEWELIKEERKVEHPLVKEVLVR